MTPSLLRMSMRIMEALRTGPMNLSTLAASVCRTKPNTKSYVLRLVGSGHVAEHTDKLNRWQVYSVTGKPLEAQVTKRKGVGAAHRGSIKPATEEDMVDNPDSELAHDKKLRQKFKSIVPFADAKALPRNFFRSVKCEKPKAVRPTMG